MLPTRSSDVSDALRAVIELHPIRPDLAMHSFYCAVCGRGEMTLLIHWHQIVRLPFRETFGRRKKNSQVDGAQERIALERAPCC